MELDLVHWIQKTLPNSPSAVIGNGDDCAVLQISQSTILVATDMLLDGTHFMSDQMVPEIIGRKAVAVNFSDIAAMGGTPLATFVSLALPKNMDLNWIQRVLNGAFTLAREFGCGIDGGDSNTWSEKFAINVCVVGKPHWRGPVRRTGAKTGDIVMVTGSSLGGSLKSGRHATFRPRIEEIGWILDRYPVSSMIDLSDGLATDARHLARANQKMLILNACSIRGQNSTPQDFKAAFCDGEDFELLFTCSPDVSDSLLLDFPCSCGIRKIGSVLEGDGVFIRERDGEPKSPLEFLGYEH